MKTYKPEGFGFSHNKFKQVDIEKAISTEEILSGYVTKYDPENGLTVKFGDKTGCIPLDEVEYSPYGEKTKPIAAISKVGKTVNFKIISNDNGNIVLSRKASMKEAYAEFVKNLKPGDVVDAKITHIERYGAFCDIACGLTYLLPIENFCVTRVGNAKEALMGIKFIKAIVSGFNNSGKIVLTHKELLGTWDSEASLFNVGNVAVGVVRSIEDYGVFIELNPNLSGLAEYTDKVQIGDRVNVLIKSIIPEKMKIKLSILDLDKVNFENDPKIHIEYRGEIPEHIDYWRYSSEKADKVIETSFDKYSETCK